jgi:putative membrane protein
MTDYAFAIAHHLLVFGLAGVLAIEIAIVSRELTVKDIPRFAKIDLWYGILAVAIVAVGFSRAVFAAKGWAYYSHNWMFWSKIGTFGLIALLSIVPTFSFLRWRRASADVSFVIPPKELRHVRGHLYLEAALFPLLLIFAAGMARGYGIMQ